MLIPDDSEGYPAGAVIDVFHMTEQQQQFLDVIDRDEAERRFRSALHLRPLGEQLVALADALGECWPTMLFADRCAVV